MKRRFTVGSVSSTGRMIMTQIRHERLYEMIRKYCSMHFGDGTEEEKEKRYADVFSFFLYGLRSCDTRLTGTCLEIIGDNTEGTGKGRRNDWRSIVISYSGFGRALKTAAETLSGDNLTGSFNPFFLTPEELCIVFSDLGSNGRTDPGSFLLECIASFDDRGRDITWNDSSPDTEQCLCLFDAVRDYFSSWITHALPLIVKDSGRLTSRDGENILAFFTDEERGHLGDPRYYPAFDALFPLYLDSSDEPELEDGLNLIIEASLCAPDDHVFRTAVRAADEMKIEWHVNRYPPYSGEILDEILKRGKLMPGTEEGRTAFIHLLRTYNPEEEIIERTIRPSYYRYDDVSPITAAVMNPVFPPEKYVLLIFTPDDVNIRRGLTPLGYAYLGGRTASSDTLISLGADPFLKDERGNNTAHYLLSLDGIDLERVIANVPPSLLAERNSDGRTPLDYYLGKEKIDFGERWNNNRFVGGMYWPYEAFRDGTSPLYIYCKV